MKKEAYQKARRLHWDRIAKTMASGGRGSRGYHRRLQRIFCLTIHEGARVLEIGCGRGDLLASVRPSFGCGVDFSGEMIGLARKKHPDLKFVEADAHDLDLGETFDFIILSDLVDDLWDVQTVLEAVRKHSTPRTRVILNLYSHLWELPLKLAVRLGLATPTLEQNWLTVEDVKGLLDLAGFESIDNWQEVLWPLRTPLVDSFFNRFLAKIAPFRYFALSNFVVARPFGKEQSNEPTVSVIVAARNEAGNIEQIFKRTPTMGSRTELVFVEGHSLDNTFEEIEKQIAAHPDRPAFVFRQPGKGKADAVRLGFENATGEILMILDADMTVPPEDLPRFYKVLVSGKAEFANGVRLVYPMEDEAMRFLNLLGNKFFAAAFSWLLGQPIKDTLCGTKVVWKRDYDMIVSNRSYFGDFDPFGDYDLIFGAAKLKLKFMDVPVRYRNRTYGSTQISRWSHGWLLLRMVAFAARRIKFV